MVVPWRWRCDFEYHGNIVGIVEHIPKGEQDGLSLLQTKADQTIAQSSKWKVRYNIWGYWTLFIAKTYNIILYCFLYKF